MTSSVALARRPSRPACPEVWLATAGQAAGPAAGKVVAAGGRRSLLLRVEPGAAGPVSFTRGELGAVFDGLLYDREQLRDSLGGVGDAGENDAELVLRAYEEWGEEAPARLKGIFALCIVDGRRGRVLAARDRVGVYPLFYSLDASALRLATTLEAFGTLGGAAPAVDPGVLAGVLARHHPGLEQTFHLGIRRVPPGSMLVGDGSSFRVARYWRPPAVGAGAEWVDESELGDFGRLLDQAVGRALGKGPAGIFLSGGLDSVSVAAAAVEHSRARGMKPPRALSLLFPGDVSEEETQRAVAGRLGISLTTMELLSVVGERGMVQAALDYSVTSASPPQNVWLPAYDELAREGKRQGCRSILTGGGGDEWLTVTPLLAADLIAKLDLPGLLRFAAALQRSMRLPTLPLWRNVMWTNGLRPLLKSRYRQLQGVLTPKVLERRAERGIAERLQRLPAWLAPDVGLRQNLERGVVERTRARAERPPGPGVGGHYFAQMEHSLQHPLFALDIEEIFESGRRWGMRQFDIYWDADLIEFLYRVPPHLLNRGGRSKGLVREDLAGRFPGLGFDRQKKLLSRDFFADTLFDQSAAAWRSLGGATALADLGVVEPRGLERFVADVVATRNKGHIDDLWRILSLESWVRPRV
jgi:hypothetical protein